MRKQHTFRRMVLTLLFIVMVMAVIQSRDWIYDYYRGMSYTPSAEMSKIRDALKLTRKGEFFFNAAQPVLSDKDEFNAACRPEVNTETAVLGCYTEGDIFVYNITESELAGIREGTTAHELLHAVWARMSDKEKKYLEPALKQVYEENKDILKDELNTYNKDARQEELYVRAGTEVKKLPVSLENHFAKYFEDQDLVVSFYKKYIKVFNEIESEMDKLKSETEELGKTIDAKIAEYKNRLDSLKAEVDEFNNCAATIGCFANESVFYARRAVLLATQSELDGLVDEINALINDYNNKVEIYNQDVTRTEQLNRMINSYSEPEVIE